MREWFNLVGYAEARVSFADDEALGNEYVRHLKKKILIDNTRPESY